MIFWISGSDFPPSQIAKEFVGWMKSGPKDIGTATFETLRICEKSMNYEDGGLSFWRQRPEHAANDLSIVKEKETHRKSSQLPRPKVRGLRLRKKSCRYRLVDIWVANPQSFTQLRQPAKRGDLNAVVAEPFRSRSDHPLTRIMPRKAIDSRSPSL